MKNSPYGLAIMDVPEEKRSTPRMALHQLVQFERAGAQPHEPGGGLTQGVGRDISAVGASLLTDCPLQQGEILRLCIPEDAERSGDPVVSEVRWTQPTRHGFRVGLQFLA